MKNCYELPSLSNPDHLNSGSLYAACASRKFDLAALASFVQGLARDDICIPHFDSDND
jgi:hypothetical protein